MSPEVLFLAIRIAGALILYAFLGLVLYGLWRDFRAANSRTVEAPRAYLVLDDSHQRFHLRPHSDIGRAPGNVVRIEDETISAHHARIMFQNGQWWIEDLASRNGTEVNGLPVEEPLVVSYGDQIRMGRVLARLESGANEVDDHAHTLSPGSEQD